MKTKKVTITITEEQQRQAKELSKNILGKENISGLVAYWINKFAKSKQL
jgi:hypothetical protein